MIRNKKDLKFYLERDRIADGYIGKRPKIIGSWSNQIWRYKIFMRKAEYYRNIEKKNILAKIAGALYLFRYTRLGIKLGFTIPLNVAKEGLSIPHYGTIIINGNSHIGKNCRIMTGVVIGSTGGVNVAASIGNNVYIGTGSKIIGDLTIGDAVCIGANSVVTKNIESGITIAGVPAKKISDNSSYANLSAALIKVSTEEHMK